MEEKLINGKKTELSQYFSDLVWEFAIPEEGIRASDEDKPSQPAGFKTFADTSLVPECADFEQNKPACWVLWKKIEEDNGGVRLKAKACLVLGEFQAVLRALLIIWGLRCRLRGAREKREERGGGKREAERKQEVCQKSKQQEHGEEQGEREQEQQRIRGESKEEQGKE
eukprot:s1728_g13.t1